LIAGDRAERAQAPQGACWCELTIPDPGLIRLVDAFKVFPWPRRSTPKVG